MGKKHFFNMRQYHEANPHPHKMDVVRRLHDAAGLSAHSERVEVYTLRAGGEISGIDKMKIPDKMTLSIQHESANRVESGNEQKISPFFGCLCVTC